MKPGLLESLDITASHMTPDHLATIFIRFMLYGSKFVRMIQQINNLTGELNMITEGEQPALTVSEQLLSMPVWCGYYGFAHTQCISERTGNNLRLIQVRRDVNISCADKLQQILIRHKVIVKNNMVLNP